MFTENYFNDNVLLSKCFIERIVMSPVTVPRNFILSMQEKMGEGLGNDALKIIRKPFDFVNAVLGNVNTNSYSIKESDRALVGHAPGLGFINLVSVPLSYPVGLVLKGLRALPPINDRL